MSRGWLGVQIQEVTPAIAASLGLKGEDGALVAVVTPNSPAAKAGLKQGDVILSFNGSAVKQLRDLPRLVAADRARHRGGADRMAQRQIDRAATPSLGEAPENPQVASAGTSGEPSERGPGPKRWACISSPLTGDLRRELNIGRDVQGVVITGIDSGSAARSLGLSPRRHPGVDQPAAGAQPGRRRPTSCGRSPNRRRRTRCCC